MKPANPAHRKRFYEAATFAESEAGFQILLDGRPIRTPAGQKLAVPSQALAAAIAAEWNAQGETIVPATLPMTKLANSAIDAVADKRADVVDDIVRYAGSDLLCYRASSPAELVARQAAAWNPILAWVEVKYNALFAITSGVTYSDQPPASLEAIRNALLPLDAFKLAALHVMTALTGSALISLAHIGGFLDCDSAWKASRIDEDWQVERWGEDYEAAQRNVTRFTEFETASRFYYMT